MSNPFANMQLKYAPDFVLAISGLSFAMAFGALIAGVVLPGGTLGWVLLSASVNSFGVAWKNAHYRKHDKTIYKWVSAWRLNSLSNFFVFISICLLVASVYVFIQTHNKAFNFSQQAGSDLQNAARFFGPLTRR